MKHSYLETNEELEVRDSYHQNFRPMISCKQKSKNSRQNQDLYHYDLIHE